MPVDTRFTVKISYRRGLLTGHEFPEGYKADGLQLARLATLGRLFPCLQVHYSRRGNWGTKDDPKYEPMYWAEIDFPMSVLFEGALHGPGSGPRATVAELTAALWEWALMFRSCGVFEPCIATSRGVYGPVTPEKRDRVRLLGVIPGRWPDSCCDTLTAGFRGQFDGLSLEATVGISKVGSCMRLCIPRGLGEPVLVPHPRWPCAWDSQEAIPRPVADEMIASGWLAELREDSDDGKIGWRDAGLPGVAYHVYAMKQ